MLVPIFKGEGDVRNCKVYSRVQLWEHAMKIVKRVLERRIRESVNIDSMLFSFMSGRGITDALLMVRRKGEEYRDKEGK